MAIMTMVLGKSGTGKSTSLRRFEKSDVLLIQVVKKPLPFRNDWKPCAKNTDGNIYTTDASDKIINAMQRTTKSVIVIDDFQYVMANEFMRASNEKGYDKFTSIARNAWDIINAASQLDDSKRVYFLSHTDEDDFGNVKAKTIGKMLDDKICLEGLFSIVLRTKVQDQQYLFSTQNNGRDTVKSPMGLFEKIEIDNDLKAVDSAICNYYSI